MRFPALLTAAMILLGAAALAAEPDAPPAAAPVEATPQAAPPTAAPVEASPQVPPPAAAPVEASPQVPPPAAAPVEATPQVPPPAVPPPAAPPQVPPPAVPPPAAPPQVLPPPAGPQAAPPPGGSPPAQFTPAPVIPVTKAETARGPVYISMDFTDVDLPVLIKFMAEQTKKNFIFDERVQGKITIISPRRLTLEEAYNVFLSVLQVKGFTTVEQGNTIKIIAAREARQDTIPLGSGRDMPPSAEFITRLVPLQFASSTDVVALLTPLVSKDGMVSAFAASNMLLLIDSRANIDRLLGILAEIDVEGARELRVFPLINAPVQEVAKTLDVLFKDSAAPAGGALGRRGLVPPSRAAAMKFIPDTRTNSLIVVAAPEAMAEVSDIIAKLDISIPATGRINVYYLENADAEEVSKVLASLSGGAQGQSPAQARVPGQPATAVQQAAGKGIIAAELEGGVKVTADKATNSLIIVASANDFLTLTEVIRKLDIRRRQVFVEAVFLEINLDKGLDLGVEWRGAIEVNNGSGALLGGTNYNAALNDLLTAIATGNPLLLPGQGLIAGGIGGSVTLPDGTKVPAIAAVLRAAASKNNLNILSTPHLLTQNNKEAEIIVGENVPFITSTSRDSTNLANVINTVERKDVGVTLRITPHIHESEYVSLDIYQEASALKTASLLESTTIGPTTTKRATKTTVLVKSGDTVIIGGMMQTQNSRQETKVPLLGDIPILGYLFKFTSETKSKTNLVILLTPYVIQEPGDLSQSLAERQRKMLNAFDPNLDEVKRALPLSRGVNQP